MNNSTKNHTILYRYFDADDNLLYVGITNNQFRRFSQHKNKDWMSQICRATFEHFEYRTDAEMAEMNAIKNESPVYNIAGHPDYTQNQNKITIRFSAKMHLVQMLSQPEGGHDEIHKDWSDNVKSWINSHECWDLNWDTHLAWHLNVYRFQLEEQKVTPFKAHEECDLCLEIFESDWYGREVSAAKTLFEESGLNYFDEMRKEFSNER